MKEWKWLILVDLQLEILILKALNSNFCQNLLSLQHIITANIGLKTCSGAYLDKNLLKRTFMHSKLLFKMILEVKNWYKSQRL